MTRFTYVLAGHTLADDLGVLVDEDKRLGLGRVGEAAGGERRGSEERSRAAHHTPGEH